MYKNIIFDVYGTLIDIYTNEHDIAVWQKVAQTLAFYDVDYTAAELMETYLSACELQVESGKRKYKHPEVDVVESFRMICANKGKKLLKTLLTHLAQEMRAFSTEHIRLYPAVHETLDALKKQGKRLFILSNAQACFTQPELKKYDLTKYFDEIFLSSDYGVAKPDAAFFDILIAKHKLARKETIYVGNDPICDVDGARNARIDCLWIKTNGTTPGVNPKVAPRFVVHDGDFAAITPLLTGNVQQ